MYKALPDCLTIDKSKIHGLGLFATEDIDKDINLGISHVKNTSSKFENNYVRTPLGGCINHSDDPNCIKFIPNVVVAPDVKVSLPDYMSLKTIKKITLKWIGLMLNTKPCRIKLDLKIILSSWWMKYKIVID